MASNRKTMKRRVTKRRGGGKRYKRNKITRKRHYGGITEPEATEIIKKLRIEGLKKNIKELKQNMEDISQQASRDRYSDVNKYHPTYNNDVKRLERLEKELKILEPKVE